VLYEIRPELYRVLSPRPRSRSAFARSRTSWTMHWSATVNRSRCNFMRTMQTSAVGRTRPLLRRDWRPVSRRSGPSVTSGVWPRRVDNKHPRAARKRPEADACECPLIDDGLMKP